MKPIICGALVALTVSAAGLTVAAAADGGFKVVDTIAGTSLKFIQSALPVFTSSGLKLDGYRITVVKLNGHYAVIFDDPNTPPGCLGSCSREKPSFEVKLSEDGTVVGGHFVR